MEFNFAELDLMVTTNHQGEGEVRHFFSPGRLEILGNHTDHNHGLVLVSPASIGIYASVIARADRLIYIESKGYGKFHFSIDSLLAEAKEKGSPLSLAKGVASGLAKAGYKIGGFTAVFDSKIPSGSGISSSAAFELLCAQILNDLYNEGNISRLDLAKIGQYSENVYFGKPSGLLDQCGSSYGGLCYIDFENPMDAKVKNLEWPFTNLKIVITNPGLSHRKMTPLYASIPADMKKAASLFHKEYLRDVPVEDYYAGIYADESGLSDIEKKRATHFFEENRRVLRALKAIEEKNEGMFLEIIRASHLSSAFLLENAMAFNKYAKSPLEAVNLANSILTKGASRLMGGGFAGTTLSFIYEEEWPLFKKTMEKAYGEGSLYEVSIPPLGAHEVK